MIKKTLIAAALFSMSTAVIAGPSEGDWEIAFTNMGASLATDGDNTAIGASVRAGKFFWGSNHEFGLAAAFSYIDLDALGSDEAFGLGGFYRHNWATEASEKWWYAGVDLDITDLEEAGDSLVLRPHAGHKWMLSEDVSFDLNLGIAIDVDESDNDPVFDAQWGITVFF